MKLIKLLWGIVSSIRIYLDEADLILQIRGTQFKFTEQDLLINTERHIGLNSSQKDILKSQRQVLQTQVPTLETYRRQKCEYASGQQVAKAECN